MHTVRRPSLELSWLPISELKGMPTPEIRFVDEPRFSGYYLRRGERIDELEHSGARDVLVISTTHGSRPATIAHEFRHMQQHYCLALPRIGECQPLDFGATHESWAAAIRIFYSRPWERDALNFECRLQRDETNESTLEALGVAA